MRRERLCVSLIFIIMVVRKKQKNKKIRSRYARDHHCQGIEFENRRSDFRIDRPPAASLRSTDLTFTCKLRMNLYNYCRKASRAHC